MSCTLPTSQLPTSQPKRQLLYPCPHPTKKCCVRLFAAVRITVPVGVVRASMNCGYESTYSTWYEPKLTLKKRTDRPRRCRRLCSPAPGAAHPPALAFCVALRARVPATSVASCPHEAPPSPSARPPIPRHCHIPEFPCTSHPRICLLTSAFASPSWAGERRPRIPTHNRESAPCCPCPSTAKLWRCLPHVPRNLHVPS